jgi:N-acylneuraminate cytidylyltransferase
MLKNIKSKFNKVKLLALDFDGVLTDGYVRVDQDGRESVRCSRKDGLGIELLKKNKIEVVVLSKEANPVVAARCRKLKIKCWQKIANGEGKLEILKRIMKEKGVSPEEVAYMGDDLNDLKVLEKVGLAVTVADGHELAKRRCHYVTKAQGGQHAVREVCEEILKAKNINLES